MVTTLQKLVNTSVALTNSVWTRVLPPGMRKYLDIRNESTTADVLYWFGENPWCLAFNGTSATVANDGLAASATLLAGTSGSIIADIKVTNTAAVKTILSFGDTNANEFLQFAVDANEKLTATLRKAAAVQWTLTCTLALTVGKWYRVKLVHNGTEPAIYVDGEKPGQTFSVTTAKTAWLSALSGIDNARIGSLSVASAGDTLFFSGYIGEVSVYNKVGVGDSPADDRTMLARYLVSEGTGTTIADVSGNAYTGTITDATWDSRDTTALLLPAAHGYAFDEQVPVTGVWAMPDSTGCTAKSVEGY
jgi:hypothetical protein